MLADGEPIRPGRGAGKASGAPGPSRPGLLARLLVRAMVIAAAGVMATGFLGWRAGLLVAGLTALTQLLLASAALRIPAPSAPERLLRSLRAGGYRLVPDAVGRHLAVGPGGLFLLETRSVLNSLSRDGGTWLIGTRPAERVVARLTSAADRAERALLLTDDDPPVVPVIAVTGRLPEPVMRADRAVIARPRSLSAYILDRSAVLTPDRVDALTESARRLRL